jgi:signal transduction histidine kinase
MPKPFTHRELHTSLESITRNLFLRRTTRQMTREGKQHQRQFLSVLSHELKSAINVVKGYIKIVPEKQAGDATQNSTFLVSLDMKFTGLMKTKMP